MRAVVRPAFVVCFVVAAAGCGRTALVGNAANAPGGGGGDMGAPVGGGALDLAVSDDGGGGEGTQCARGGDVCPPGFDCVDGQCCAGALCFPPLPGCGPSQPCPAGEQCLVGICLPSFDLGTRPSDLGRPPPPADMGNKSGCSNDGDCPGAVCDFLTGQCVPLVSCAADRDCAPGEACIGHQCLPFQACLPFPLPFPIPGVGPCPPDERCQFPPGVCVPAFNCGGPGSCPTGETCVGGYCQPSGCASDSECNDGYACVGGECRPRRYCGPFLPPCPRRQRCDAHVCVPR